MASRARDIYAPTGQQSQLLLEAVPILTDWFARYGGDPRREIEARVKDISQTEFNFICSRLSTNAFTQTLSKTIDTNYVNRTRCTRTCDSEAGSAAAPPSYLRKEQLERADVLGRAVRLSVSSETPAPPPGEYDSVEVVRWKQRRSFAYKREFLYELTEVRSGFREGDLANAPLEYEVELEWSGQARAASRLAVDAGFAAHLAQSMASKVQDLLDMCGEARRRATAAPPMHSLVPAAAVLLGGEARRAPQYLGTAVAAAGVIKDGTAAANPASAAPLPAAASLLPPGSLQSRAPSTLSASDATLLALPAADGAPATASMAAPASEASTLGSLLSVEPGADDLGGGAAASAQVKLA